MTVVKEEIHMFEKFKNMTDQIQMAQKLMKDENFRNFMMHPKVQELLKDPQFQESLKKQDPSQLFNHPKVLALQTDPEIARLAAKLKG